MRYKDIVFSYIESTERRNHTLGVSKKCGELAKHYRLDVEKAATIGLLHDIAKELPLFKQREYMEEAGYNTNISNRIWHAYVGAYIIEKELGINDAEIILAIKYHTTGHIDMTPLMKILFIADMTEEYRDEEFAYELRRYEYIDLDIAVAKKLKWLTEKLENSHIDSVEAYERYKSALNEN